MSPVTPAEDARSIMINHISWGAVLAGVVVGLVTQLILNMIGIGIGAATLDPGAGDGAPQASTFSIGAAIWFGVASILAALVGGFVAGRLSGRPKESTGGWHGLTTWAVTTLLIFYLLTTTLGSIIGGAYQGVTGLVGNVASAAGGAAQTAAEAAPEDADPMAAIEQAIRGATGANPGELLDGAVASVRGALTGDPAQSAQALDTAAQSLSEAQGIPIEEARAQVEQYQQQYQETAQNVQETVTETADVAATAVSRGTLYSALGLILSGIAAFIGGRMGTVDPTVTARIGRRV